VPFDVIGVMERKGVMPDGSDEDNEILVPLRTALRRVLNVTWLNGIFVSVDDAARVEEIRGVMRQRHARDDFAIQNTLRLVQMQQRAADALTLLATGIGGVALLVGGAGILALMLMTVKERTPEIGLRVAVGARPRDILAQFLFEAALLALSGWLAGALVAALGIGAVVLATTWKVGAPVAALVSSFSVALTIGLGFGAVPARKASLIPPIEALLAE
jgi:putative ABC transport system permease protein